MNNWNQNVRNDDRKEDKPPFSRLFVVCSKQIREEDLRAPFEKFGCIENLFMPKDRNTYESKGVAYIKYSKTSSAATAIQELHMKCLENEAKPIKVMVATNKNDIHNTNEDRYKRLFIKVSKDATEMEIRQHFAEFGRVESVHLQRDKATDTCKGFAYVHYKTFVDAAKGFEECDRKYKPMFAIPRDELKRSRNSLDGYAENYYSMNSNKDMFNDNFIQNKDVMVKHDSLCSLIKTKPQDFDTIIATCSPQVAQKHMEKLFNIVPGMLQFQYSTDSYNGFCRAVITYEDKKAAAYAIERLNNYEFPSGEIVSVKPQENVLTKAADNLANIVNNFKHAMDTGNPDLMQLADAIAQASTLIKAATSGKVDSEIQEKSFCSVSLPPPQPMATTNRIAQRCFIVCKPHPPPNPALKDVFSRFGDLIDVSTFPNKTFGFAKYASMKAAQDAIKTLNGAMVCGVRLKVIEADEKPFKDEEQKMSLDSKVDNDEHDIDRKRAKRECKDENMD